MRYFLCALIGVLFLTSHAFAASYFYCGKTLSYIYVGDSEDKVKTACGDPNSLTEKEVPVPAATTSDSSQWIYHYQPNSAQTTGQTQMQQNALVFSFSAGKIASIMVEGKPVQQTTYCRPDVQLKVGDSSALVYQACRQPTLKQTPPPPQTQTKTQTIYTYKNPTTNLSTTLTFEDGKLIQIGAP